MIFRRRRACVCVRVVQHHYAPSYRRRDVLRWRYTTYTERGRARARTPCTTEDDAACSGYSYLRVREPGSPCGACANRSAYGVRLTARASPCVCSPGARGRNSGARKRRPAAQSDSVITGSTGSRRIGASRVSGPAYSTRITSSAASVIVASSCAPIHAHHLHSRGLYPSRRGLYHERYTGALLPR